MPPTRGLIFPVGAICNMIDTEPVLSVRHRSRSARLSTSAWFALLAYGSGNRGVVEDSDEPPES